LFWYRNPHFQGFVQKRHLQTAVDLALCRNGSAHYFPLFLGGEIISPPPQGGATARAKKFSKTFAKPIDK
jgi:hypothetical protein